MNAERQMNQSVGDWPFLTEEGRPYSGMLSNLLEQNGIPFVTKSNMGMGMALKVGFGSERTRFYVPPDCLERAKAIVITFRGSSIE